MAGPGINKDSIITATSFYPEGKEISRLVRLLSTLGMVEEAAQAAVFITLWCGMFGRDSLTKEGCGLEIIINSLPADSQVRDILIASRKGWKTLPANLRGQVMELGKAIKKKISPRDRKEMSTIMGMLYEAFLHYHDPMTRKKYGVYSTPYPLTVFIVRSIHRLLREAFQLSMGIASGGLAVFDPAAGTGVFMDSVLDLAVKSLSGNCEGEINRGFIRRYLGRQSLSMETLLIPYILQIICLYDRACTGSQPGIDIWKHLLSRVRHQNTLELEPEMILNELTIPISPAAKPFSKKRYPNSQKGFIKGEDNNISPDIQGVSDLIPVILGNPPYAVHSANNHTPAATAIKSYFSIAGKRLQEKNFKALQDDYIKFLCQAQSIVERAGKGIIAFVTNNSFLDNITFRGMRHSLLNSFDEIHILNLNGGHQKTKSTANGSGDKNIFPARLGISVSFFIKKNRRTGAKECKVYYADLMGAEQEKYSFLKDYDIITLDRKLYQPQEDYYLFKPSRRVKKAAVHYTMIFKLTEIFSFYGTGIVTARDKLAIGFDPETMLKKVRKFADSNEENARNFFQLGNDSRDWNVKRARQDILEHGIEEKRIVPILYRPFDIRYTYYTGRCRGFQCMPRWNIMRNMLLENLALVTVRQVEQGIFNHGFAASTLVDSRVTSNNRGISFVFPLYTYLFPQLPTWNQNKRITGLITLRRGSEIPARQANINPAFRELLARGMEGTFSPTVKQVFYYIYGILFSNTYRRTFAEQLRSDFPCIPFTSEAWLFKEIAGLGEELCGLHLFTSPFLKETEAQLRHEGNLTVNRKKIRFVFSGKYKKRTGSEGDNDSLQIPGRVYINETGYFTGIPLSIWEYELCGYRVLERWLKLRDGMKLGVEEVTHFKRMVRAVQLTGEFQQRIDGLYDGI